MKTPILLIIFNRPDFTRTVLEEIQKANPSKLFVAADGPRPNMRQDILLCAETRAIIRDTTFKFPVKVLFREENLGCKNAVSSAIDWFFSYESEGIILEDDCIPHQDFFRYCEELLEKYRDDSRIMMISGDNFLPELQIESSYYFSQMTHIWGWASWNRAWKHYDVNMDFWPEFKTQKNLMYMFHKKKYWKGWEELMDNTHSGIMNTWDYQWQFTCWIQGGLSCMPKVNLVTNIGTLDPSGTHTNPLGSDENIISSQSMSFPLTHPLFKIPNYHADNLMLKKIFANHRHFFIQKIHDYYNYVKSLCNTYKKCY